MLANDEGELHWISLSEILMLEMPLTVRYTLEHFIKNQENQIVHIGTLTQNQSKFPDIIWAPLLDPEGD